MIYFIQDEATFHIKIGFTDGEPEDRLAALQTGCPSRIVLLASIAGDRTKEKELHARFAAHRVVGEWFNPSPALLTWLFHGLISDAQRVSDATGWSRGYSQGCSAGQKTFSDPGEFMEYLEELGVEFAIDWYDPEEPELEIVSGGDLLTEATKRLLRFHEFAITNLLYDSITK